MAVSTQPVPHTHLQDPLTNLLQVRGRPQQQDLSAKRQVVQDEWVRFEGKVVTFHNQDPRNTPHTPSSTGLCNTLNFQKT